MGSWVEFLNMRNYGAVLGDTIVDISVILCNITTASPKTAHINSACSETRPNFPHDLGKGCSLGRKDCVTSRKKVCEEAKLIIETFNSK